MGETDTCAFIYAIEKTGPQRFFRDKLWAHFPHRIRPGEATAISVAAAKVQRQNCTRWKAVVMAAAEPGHDIARSFLILVAQKRN
ncbi:MAG TPA: hypothetical protein VFQ43_05800 [Nitrososphaera sp.]|nr:hypothetical protein [Nitrososphaera sp.]